MVDSDANKANLRVGWIEDEDSGGDEEDEEECGGVDETGAMVMVAGTRTVGGKENDDVLLWVRIGIRVGVRVGIRVGGKGRVRNKLVLSCHVVDEILLGVLSYTIGQQNVTRTNKY